MPPDKILLTEFELYLQFEKESADPQRVFRTLTRVIDVLGAFDELLLRLLDAELTADLTLRDVKAGSLRTRLAVWVVPVVRPLMAGELGEAVQAGEPWRAAGVFVNKALLALIRYLENKQGLDNPAELRYLQDQVDQLARQTPFAPLGLGTLHPGRLADEISNLTKALAALGPRDVLEYRAAEGRARFNPRFSTDNLSALAGAGLESATQHRVRLRIKKPDFLGESRWEFRLNDQQNISARLTDARWLERFHAGEVTIKSGDLLEVELQTEYVHIPNYTTAQVHYTIPKVWRVVSPPALPVPTLFG